MRKKMKLLLLGTLCFTQLQAQVTQYVDMRTGVVGANNTGGLQAYGTAEDTWSLTMPSGLPGTAKVAQLPGTWPSSTSARWISPFVNGSGTAIAGGPYYYIYTMTFTTLGSTSSSGCYVDNAEINLSEIGADNWSTILFVNGDAYAFSHGTSPLTSQTINVTPSIIPGAVNTIVISGVFNGNSGNSTTGLLLNGGMTIDYLYPPALFTGPSTFCANDPLTFNVNDVPGSATHYFMGIVAWDNVSMVDMPSVFNWTQWYNGSPGNTTYTFPVNPPCNQYYHVKIAVQDECTPWHESNLIIKINCGPVANAGPDQTICAGQCVNIGVPVFQKFCTYNWTDVATGVTVGTTQQVNVCPTTTTTYQQTVTNTMTGCTSSDQVTVTVIPNPTLNPGFQIIKAWTGVNQYKASVYTLATLPAGTSFSWIIEAIDPTTPAPGTAYPISTLTNPSAYWSTPNPTISSPLVLSGYDYPNSIDPSGYLPNPGKFYVYDPNFPPESTILKYRITHGLWNTCVPWVQESQIMYFLPAMVTHDDGTTETVYQFVTEKDLDAPDYSYLSPVYGGQMTGMETMTQLNTDNDWMIYPNPGTGIFTIETGDINTGKMQVFDVTGKNIKTVELNRNKNHILDLTGFPKGIYVINLISENQLQTKKIVLE